MWGCSLCILTNYTRLYTVVSPVLILIHTCAEGSEHAPPEKKMIKWCDLVLSEYFKVCYNQPKNKKNLEIIKQQPKFCAIFFSKINPHAHFSTKINTFTFYKAGLWATVPKSPEM